MASLEWSCGVLKVALRACTVSVWGVHTHLQLDLLLGLAVDHVADEAERLRALEHRHLRNAAREREQRKVTRSRSKVARSRNEKKTGKTRRV